MKNETLKIKTNVPEIITFKFKDFKTGESEYGQWYMYTVENRGVDKTFFPSEHLHNLLQTIGDLQDKTLEILKYEDGNFKNWKISEAGIDITPKIIKKATGKPKEDRLDKMAEWAKMVEKRLDALENKVEIIEP